MSAAPAARLWRAAWVLPVSDGPLREGAVAVADGVIADVGPAPRVLARHPGLPVEDLGDVVLAPGFVDLHCHLEWSLLDGLLPPDDFAPWLGGMLRTRLRMREDDHATAALHGALRALAAGTTTLLDSGPTGAGVHALAATGQRGIVHREVFGREHGPAARGVAATVAEALRALDAAAGPRTTVGVSPHAPYTVGPDVWEALGAEPGLEGRPWATHVAESASEDRAVADGDGPLADLFAAAGMRPGRWPGAAGEGVVARLARRGGLRPGLVAAHCVRTGAADARALAAAGVAVAHCPRSNLHLRCGRAPVERLRAAGVALGLGTDSPASGGDYDLRAELRACRALHGDALPLDDHAALALITADAARAAGFGDLGRLAPGARADMVALAPAGPIGDPVVAALDPASAVVWAAVDGEPLLRDRRVLAVDADAAHSRAAEAAARLC